MLNIFVIEKDKLVSNINIVKKKAGNSKIYAVVKGDGYGLGLLRFAEILRDNGINAFASQRKSSRYGTRALNSGNSYAPLDRNRG